MYDSLPHSSAFYNTTALHNILGLQSSVAHDIGGRNRWGRGEKEVYLKSLELVGFKSFALKTKLDFEPGMTAVVGPNGCGKSNIADAVRWVLGEQSAKALRGGKMEDCIFNGTDGKRPLGMAETTITFADCENVLGTDYNEISIARRVFRSGEGQYFMNKAPCRLKDIQRLFMGTGIGTVSYSIMEQGRIDQILSSRPEDRRTIFEEASGITKFKADKKEAIRKLDQTEANLLRLSDVVREVKRQIGSLQRQAGKARRYQTFKADLRKMEIYLMKQRLATMDKRIVELKSKIDQLNNRMQLSQDEIRELERGNDVLRNSLVDTEREIGKMSESAAHARSKLEHARQLINLNTQRIKEYEDWRDRDNAELETARGQIESQNQALAELTQRLEEARSAHLAAQDRLNDRSSVLEAQEEKVNANRERLRTLGARQIDTESLISNLQNQLAHSESKERSDAIRREHLAAEQGQLSRSAENYNDREAEMTHQLARLQEKVETTTGELATQSGKLSANRKELDHVRDARADHAAEAAAKKAQLEMLQSAAAESEDLPGGARFITENEKATVLGIVGREIDASPEYRTALAAALRSWLDAVIVSKSEAALKMLGVLADNAAGSVRILPADLPCPKTLKKLPGTPLLDQVSCSDSILPVARALLLNTRIIASLADMPSAAPAGAVLVTRDGALLRGDGSIEFWLPGEQPADPVRRRQLAEGLSKELANTETRIQAEQRTMDSLMTEAGTLAETMNTTQATLDEQKRKLALKEGENQILSQEARQARERFETVSFELDALTNQDDTSGGEKQSIVTEIQKSSSQRDQIKAQIEQQTREQQTMEAASTDLRTELVEHKVKAAETRQRVEYLDDQANPLKARLQELEATMEGRRQGIISHEENINHLQQAIHDAKGSISSLEEEAGASTSRAEDLRKNREHQSLELEKMEASLSERRLSTNGLRDGKSECEIENAEVRTRKANLVDRITAEYNITIDQAMNEPEPEWKDGELDLDTLDTNIAEIKTKLDAMGPVNLVAIEEYEQLQERHSFLTKQQEDLVQAKQQLMDMIRKINATTTDMFSKTFEQINENFQVMFKKLFGTGSSSKLVLVNEEDILECGIEVIARPPGKRPQTVSLLSGGERTLTAVALLFAIYMIKPSPFCLLDELDAALDASNINRFVDVLQGFLGQSQFLVITHNNRTIAAADVLYGITMEQSGVSKIVAMKFKDHEKKKPDAPPPATAPVETTQPKA